MRTTFRFFGVALGILLGTPAWAQVDSPQQQTTTSPAPNITQEQVPAMPSIQDVRSPLNTISNRPRATTGTQPGAAAGAGQTGLTPGARTAFPGTDLQQRIKEFEFEQLQQDLQAEQRERNEFQQFVMQSIGRDLPMFGANLFRTVPSTFAPIDNVPVTPDYVIGPGDEIQIRAWGQIDVDYNAAVDRDGTISVPKVGVISVAGIKASDLPAYLKTVFGRTFRNFQLTATLGKLRSIQIFVVGQARRPGTYTVSSLSTLVTAVFGPTGSVNVPAVYELRQSTVLFDLIRWAGGLATTAAGQKATVERIEDHKARKVEEFPLDMGGLSRSIRDGDLVTVYSLVPRFDNAVALRGDVAQPGRFPWREGMRVRDLIPDREALLSRDYWIKRNQAVGLDSNVTNILNQQAATGTRLTVEDLNQRRKRESDLDATIGDTIRRLQTESEAARFLDPNQTSSAVQITRLQDANKGTVEAAKSDALRLVNQIKPSQREVNWDYAVIERLNRNDLTTSLIPFNLGKAVIDGDPEQNLLLQPGDIVTVFSKEDIKVPISKQTQYIRLEGEFNSSGVHQIMPGETLRQLIARAGGLAPNAYLFGAQFTREST